MAMAALHGHNNTRSCLRATVRPIWRSARAGWAMAARRVELAHLARAAKQQRIVKLRRAKTVTEKHGMNGCRFSRRKTRLPAARGDACAGKRPFRARWDRCTLRNEARVPGVSLQGPSRRCRREERGGSTVVGIVGMRCRQQRAANQSSQCRPFAGSQARGGVSARPISVALCTTGNERSRDQREINDERPARERERDTRRTLVPCLFVSMTRARTGAAERLLQNRTSHSNDSNIAAMHLPSRPLGPSSLAVRRLPGGRG